MDGYGGQKKKNELYCPYVDLTRQFDMISKTWGLGELISGFFLKCVIIFTTPFPRWIQSNSVKDTSNPIYFP